MCYNYIRIKMVFEVENVLLSRPCGYKEMRERAHPPNTIPLLILRAVFL